MNFETSTLGKFLKVNCDIEAPEAEAVREDLNRAIMEVRALVGRLAQMPEGADSSPSSNVLDDDIVNLVDADLTEEVRMEHDTAHSSYRELEAITNRLSELLSQPGVLAEYRQMYSTISENKSKLEKLTKAYDSGSINGKTLDSLGRTVIARQIIRILEDFKYAIHQEIQNIHNHVAVEKRDYRQTDRKTLERLNDWMSEAEARISKLVSTNHEVAMQLRSDQIKADSRTLKRVKREDIRNERLRTTGDAYIEVSSRERVIYGDNSADNYIMSAMRNGQNVELLGPTGTGKTKLAIQAAKVFSSKDPVVLPGGPGVYRSSFYGSPSDLGKRNSGSVIKCFIEDRVMIIDEDNRIDPRQLAEIKFILGLKPGDRFIHPDTGEEFIVPPHFRVVVTRNERGKHHKDRFDLPPEYRREFTHGSFEIDYYEPQEIYDRFFLPKLTNDDGSISLSKEEVGGKESDRTDRSPLLSLALAAKKIQEEYKDNKLKNAVFESGYLISVLDQWKEVQFKKDEYGDPITFKVYLETKLLEFIKRPIGNQDRKIIAQILYGHGFFRRYVREAFATANEGEIFTVLEFSTMVQGASTVFKKPSGVHLSSREVALLDPFEVRKIVIPPHPLQQEVDDFADVYADFCRTVNVLPTAFTPHNFEAKKASVVDSIRKGIDKSGQPVAKKKNLKAMVDAAEKKPLIEFLPQITKIIQMMNGFADGGSSSGGAGGSRSGVDMGDIEATRPSGPITETTDVDSSISPEEASANKGSAPKKSIEKMSHNERVEALIRAYKVIVREQGEEINDDRKLRDAFNSYQSEDTRGFVVKRIAEFAKILRDERGVNGLEIIIEVLDKSISAEDWKSCRPEGFVEGMLKTTTEILNKMPKPSGTTNASVSTEDSSANAVKTAQTPKADADESDWNEGESKFEVLV